MLDLEIIGKGATTTVYRDGSRAIKLYVDAPHDEAENESILQQLQYRHQTHPPRHQTSLLF